MSLAVLVEDVEEYAKAETSEEQLMAEAIYLSESSALSQTTWHYDAEAFIFTVVFKTGQEGVEVV
jgi:hypothetical protein